MKGVLLKQMAMELWWDVKVRFSTPTETQECRKLKLKPFSKNIMASVSLFGLMELLEKILQTCTLMGLLDLVLKIF